MIRGHVVEDEFAGFKGNANLSTSTSNATASGETPRRKASRARVRPMSSSSQQQPMRPRSMSAFDPFPGPASGGRRFSGGRPHSRISLPSADIMNADDVDPPTEVEVKISMLSAKIDKLTDIIIALQKEKDGGSASSTPPDDR